MPRRKQQRPEIQHIPELISHIGAFLDPPSLSTCIRVSRLWHNTLLPLLYNSLDDNTCSWPEIFTHLLPSKRWNPGDWTEDFIRAVLHKHGGLIRHLTVRWALFNNAVSAASEFEDGSCTKLQSLKIFGTNRSAKFLEQTCFNTWWNQDKSTWDQVEPLLSPLFAGPFRPIIHSTKFWSQQDWITFQRFWMLVYNNRSTLQRLRLDTSIGRMKDLTEEFYDILASCPRLTYLENYYQPLDLEHLLDRMPQLHHFVDHFALLNRGALSKPMPQLQTLHLNGKLSTHSLFLLLKHLPNLDQLYIGWNFVDFSERPGPIMGDTKSRLTGLHFLLDSSKTADEYIATSILPWLPNLRELTLSHLGPCTASAIPVHCQSFESFKQLVTSSSIHPSYHMGTIDNTISILLESCPNLKSIDAIQHILQANYFISYLPTWPCVKTLEHLRCQIRGISRLADADQEFTYRQALINVMIDQPLTPNQKKARDIYDFGHVVQQPLLFARLAQLTNLKVLDLGMEYRKINAAYGRSKPYYKVGAKRYVEYGGPLPDTLELTLASGLDKLKTLKKLEVFGFEGCNHRIGHEELEWMVEAWPRLKEMRGLQPVRLHCLERDISTERLNRYIRKLKPDIKHRRYPPPTVK
ncbi:hypothetical protein EC957_002966 [Mortierella hygrophila]|uniref:F-box domain-containing protein n=1 Tax=Mortierella hygrophila TaxID=979708 RepID=A0A9P6F483_9FUNG|nr:hypothetical protein EC957_002966 [Mortierella hygrophila]